MNNNTPQPWRAIHGMPEPENTPPPAPSWQVCFVLAVFWVLGIAFGAAAALMYMIPKAGL